MTHSHKILKLSPFLPRLDNWPLSRPSIVKCQMSNAPGWVWVWLCRLCWDCQLCLSPAQRKLSFNYKSVSGQHANISTRRCPSSHCTVSPAPPSSLHHHVHCCNPSPYPTPPPAVLQVSGVRCCMLQTVLGSPTWSPPPPRLAIYHLMSTVSTTDILRRTN